MSRPIRFIYHDLKGLNGWGSDLFLNRIEIARIISVRSYKRPFMIFDRDRPYVLKIAYRGRDQSMAYTISKRYQTQELLMSEINAIEIKQKELN